MPTPCPVCHSTASQTSQPAIQDYEYGISCENYRVEFCPECKTEFVSPRPNASELTRFYPAGYHAYNDNHEGLATVLVGVRAKIRERFYRKLAKGKSARLFDVGAGDCRHFRELKKSLNFDCHGVELNPLLAERAKKEGFQVEAGTLEEMNTDKMKESFDIVSMNHVLEHVVEPNVVLTKVHDMLKPQGVLVGQLPTTDCWERSLFGKYWGGYHFPRHLQLMPRKSLKKMLESLGYTNIRIESAPHLQTAISVQNLIVGKLAKLRTRFGRTWLYEPLLALVAPFEILACLFSRSGIINFTAEKA